MTKKKQLGQFFTKNSEYIVGNLIDIFPDDSTIVDPFCGEGDLLKMVKKYNIIGYDIDKKIKGVIQQDTLNNPPDYKNKWIITNPPYLSRNKNKNKLLYDKYELNDLYKISIKTIMDCEGGVIIIPLNFFSGDDYKLRNEFLTNFKIIRMNIFEETVFDDTDYTVCSFSFIKNKQEEQIIESTFFPSKKSIKYEVNLKSNFILGNEFFNIIKKGNFLKIKRLVKDKNDLIPNSYIYLRSIDTGTNDGRISLSINKDYFYAKESDRTFATLILDKQYNLDEQRLICDKFNEIIEYYRDMYNSLFLTNYRNSSKSYARKRISFDMVYSLVSYIIDEYLK